MGPGRGITSRWRATLVALALVALAGGAATAASRYDASNADKVDGRHAVGPTAKPAQRPGALVAMNADGVLPRWAVGTASDSARLGGFTHAQMAAMSIPPQGVATTGNANLSSVGPTLLGEANGGFRVSFVVPADHAAPRLTMRVVYLVSGADRCDWSFSTVGLQGPTGPNSKPNVQDGAWDLSGTGSYQGTLAVPSGPGSVRTATFTWGGKDDPGMFVQFGLDRRATAADDTCGAVTVAGLQLLY